MQIAILGAGKIGERLARVWARRGHHVAISGKRALPAMTQQAAKLGPGVEAAVSPQAVDRAEVIVLAVPWGVGRKLPKRRGHFVARS